MVEGENCFLVGGEMSRPALKIIQRILKAPKSKGVLI